MIVRNHLLFEVTFIFSFKTLRYFSSGPTPLCSSTRLFRTLLLNICLLEVRSYQQYVLPHRQHLRTSQLFFEKARLCLIMLFLFCTTCSGEIICDSRSSETFHTVISSQRLPFCSHFMCDTLFQFFLGKIKIHRILFQLIELVNITEFGREVVLQLQLPQFCKLKNEEPDTACFFVFNLCFSEFNFIR